MKYHLFLVPFFAMTLSGCDITNRINESTCVINQNTETIERSTEAIHNNLEVLEELKG